jgi:hypothetical protein
MKKLLSVLLLFLIVFISGHQTYANEETKTKYFGVGATVEEVEQATFMVKTEGRKVGEGFVFTPELKDKKDKLTFTIDLKGEGTVFLKIVETDSRGKFIKEHTSPMLLLSSKWTEYHLSADLQKNTQQIDVLVITEGKQKIAFQFRDPEIN